MNKHEINTIKNAITKIHNGNYSEGQRILCKLVNWQNKGPDTFKGHPRNQPQPYRIGLWWYCGKCNSEFALRTKAQKCCNKYSVGKASQSN